MAPPLILRIIGDATSYFKTAESTIATNTKIGKSALDMGADFTKASAAQIAAGTKSIQVQRAMVAELTAAQTKYAAGTDEQIAASVALERAQARLNSSLGVTSVATGRAGSAARTAETDVGKLTRGALAGSGVISSLGRSLAFASGGFIAVAGGATILHDAIQSALQLAATQRQVEAQLKTGGASWETYGKQIEAADLQESHLSGFTNQDLLQSFGYLYRVSGDVSQSLKLNGVAADVARGRHIALSSASLALAKALGGSSTALRRLGIIVPKTAEGMAAINYVAQKFAGQAEAGATSADRLHASLVDASEEIGTALLPTFTRLTTHLTEWLSKMEESGRLTRDMNEGVRITGTVFHTLEDAVRGVDNVTGSFAHTLEIIIALELAKKVTTWILSLQELAAAWGLVGSAATKAAAAEDTAIASGSGGAAGGGAAGGALGGLLTGGVLGSLISKARYGGSLRGGVIGEYTGAAGAGDAAALSATGVGALAVASIFAAGALNDLATKVSGGQQSVGGKISSAITGFLTGGFAGNSAFAPQHAIYGALLHGQAPFKAALQGPQAPPPQFVPMQQLQQQLDLSISQMFGKPPSGMFGSAQPLKQYWKQFEIGLRLTMAQLEAALTKSNSDDVEVAKAIVAKIKSQLDEGVLHGPALQQALQAEANALSTIWAAEAAAAQKRAAAAAAAKQKIITEIQNAIDPIGLEVALSRAQSLGQKTTPELKALLAAAYRGLAKAIANGNKQLIKQAYDQITSLKQQIKDSLTSATDTFTEPMKLQIALAREQALGQDTTQTLQAMKRAAERAIKSGKYTGQALIDLYNEIASINGQLNSDVGTAYGNYKKASVKMLTSGLGLSASARRELEMRLSQRGPGGTVPGSGVGAAGYIIDPATGRPVKVRHGHGHGSQRVPQAYGGGTGGYKETIVLKVYLDGKQIATSTTVHQQKHRRRSPSSRRGPNAATATA